VLAPETALRLGEAPALAWGLGGLSALLGLGALRRA